MQYVWESSQLQEQLREQILWYEKYGEFLFPDEQIERCEIAEQIMLEAIREGNLASVSPRHKRKKKAV